LAEQPHWLWDYATLGIYPSYRNLREWGRSWTLDDRLAEAGRRNQTEILPPYRPGDGNHASVYNLSRQYIPGYAASWQTGMEGVTVLATVGVMWTANGPMWVSPSSGNTFLLRNGRWENTKTGAVASADEAAAANRALAASHRTGTSLTRLRPEVRPSVASNIRPPRISVNWRARSVTDPACQTGCENVALQIQRHIGGKIIRIVPADPRARYLGPYRGHNPNWAYHEVVVKDGRVYDVFTGHQGATIAEYKALWEYADAINFGF
jgi:hypothetical protein